MNKITKSHAEFYGVFLLQMKGGFKAMKTKFSGKLTVKQENFCLEYAKSGNATKSYLKAYSKDNSYSAAGVESCRLLKNPKIKARLQELHQIHNAKKIMQVEEMKERLTNIARDDSNLKHSLKAMELLAKIGGLFVSKQELEINSAVPVVIVDNV